jgi:putative ABC transport system substrate-binding protein
MLRILACLLGLALALAAAAAPATTETPAGKVYRLGVLAVSERSVDLTRDVTVPELAKLGFVDGRNLTWEARFGTPERLPALAQELIAGKPDVILAVGGEAIRAAQAATKTVPIVIYGPDPVRLGFAESISRPGGNVTGVVILATELDGKRLELLHEAIPSARRLAALVHPTSPNRTASDAAMAAVAAAGGFELRLFTAAGAPEYPAAFAAMRRAGAAAVAIVAAPEFYRDAPQLMRLALAARLPSACQWSEMAQAGCLFSYGPSLIEMRRRVAHYIARILNGAAPGSLPVEQPTKFELAVNLKTAAALGITVPQSILLRADQVIE